MSLDTPVFRRDGRPITVDYLYKRFKQYVTDLGLAERINFHSTRHTAATLLVILMQNLMGLVRDSKGYSLEEFREILDQDHQML